ncbi:glycosyltransferase family 1 protein [Hyaloscypha variabilis F]|uniref:Glycosyltransferase family 1 protein n=1 Tax=Hyaloscypha variabilis (strain UAMH 11265 / GT02V1 / F) TaxID=1149755 RepID=A0A2J6RQU5_HYAVF|nr:glycosyltransferase family 1 protein [Hyaloscypha variabilis F]
MTSIKAHVVIGALPFESHLTPMRTIAQHLVPLGYQVTFITAGNFRQSIGAIGATCFVPAGWYDVSENGVHIKIVEGASKMPPSTGPVPAVNIMASRWFADAIPLQFEAIQEILASSLAENPSRPVVLLLESSFLASLPFVLNAPGLRPKGVISVGNVPILDINPDTPPPSSGLQPDPSPEGRARNEALNKTWLESSAILRTELNTILRGLGAKEIDQYRQNAVLNLSTLFLQLCPPSLEFHRSNAPPTLRFTGGLPRPKHQSHNPSELPGWWSEVVNKGNNRIVAVSQGTIVNGPESLIIPTLEALKDQDSILVVVALGKRGASLPAEYSIPSNARVADWIPFDALLPLSDVFVTNGGYGSFQNALANGVPLVIAPPRFADKRDIAARVQWSGTGVNLGTGTPTVEALKDAVLEVFNSGKYKERALEVKKEIESYDSMAIITGAIDEVANS